VNIIETKDVSKYFEGHVALDKVNINIKEGSIYGLLGPNGAGKTTLLRIINQIFLPDTGSVYFMGRNIKSSDINNIGYLPEERGLYKKMQIAEQIVYFATLKGLSSSEAKKKAKYWLEKLNMTNWWNRKVEELSKGMQQKIQFIITVIHNPKLLIFDEIFSGLDPVNVNMIKEEILNLRKEGATIIFSTHNMGSVEELCDEIALINKSKKILEGKVKDIKENNKENIYEIKLLIETDNIDLDGHPGYKVIDKVLNGNVLEMKLEISKNINSNEILSNFMQKGKILSYREILPTMNEIFINKVKSLNN